jgi:hypothetical protein
MNSTIELLNRVLESYKGVAIAGMFNLSSGAVSTWKKNQHISAYYAAKLAELIGEDPERAVALAGAEAEHDPEKKAYLLNMLAMKGQQLVMELRPGENGGPPVSRTRHQRIMSPLL